jgi:small subunit ribosomal protein S3
MGQKVNPYGLRLGIVKNWKSIWYDEKDYAKNFLEDISIRNYFPKLASKDGKDYGIADIIIERFPTKININVLTARPGMIYGPKGANIEEVKKQLETMLGKSVKINIRPIKKAELNATLAAQNIAAQLEKRIPFRRAMKQAMTNALQAGAKGVKVRCGGRLAGAEIARVESYQEGKVPLHTLRADIDYGSAEANTTFGKIGVKVWIYHGDVFAKDLKARNEMKEAR